MRLFAFLSRFTFICNIAFLLFVFFRWMELKKVMTGPADQVVAVPFFKDLVITLGVCAIIINFLMNVFFIFLIVRRKNSSMKLLLPVINFLFLIVQVIYFLF